MSVLRPKGCPAVIFDLDGTLADTLEDITHAVNQALAELGRPAVPPERIRPLIGEGLPSLLQRASGIEDPAAVATLVARYRPLYTESMLRHTQLYPGMAAVLTTLTDAAMPMCVLSNKPHEYTAPICAALLSRWPFVQCLGYRDGRERKPDPAVALELAGAMGHPPGDCYFVGDSEVDVRTGRNAGMIPVAVTWGFRPRPELESADAAHYVDHPRELADLLVPH